MNNGHYSIAHRVDYYSDIDDIVSILTELSVLLKPITIISYYHELPISSVSSLEKVDVGKYEITLSEMHMQVISNQDRIILALDNCTVLAECSSKNIHKKTVVIYGFQYISLHAEKRKSFRLTVCADVKLLVAIRKQGGKIDGRLVDISITGCKVKIQNTDGLHPGIAAVLEIQIFDQAVNKELCRSFVSKIIHVFQSDDAYYCCLEFIGTYSDQDLLARFLNQKQAALVRDFRQHKVLPE